MIHCFSKTNLINSSLKQINYAQVIYKKISDVTQSKFLIFAVTQLSTSLKNQLWLILSNNELVQSILAELINYLWDLKNNILYHQNWVYISEVMQLFITTTHHNISIISHYSITYILNFVICEHYWSHICKFIQDYVNQC